MSLCDANSANVKLRLTQKSEIFVDELNAANIADTAAILPTVALNFNA